jgi:A/G-specific adenine glycosylase
VVKKKPTTVSDRLLAWYGENARDLPWRRTRDPYRIWVSEIMLQQTQVDTASGFYDRFFTRFPTVQALATAPLRDVLKAWENMGYYARARNLHKAAKEIVGRFDGGLPQALEELESLPGIGPYTARAVGSIAFDRPVPAVDANVKRVVARLEGIGEPIDQTATKRRIETVAAHLVPEKGAGHFNQALMDLGSTICTPTDPTCAACPLQPECRASRKGTQSAIPVTRKRKPIPHRQMTGAVLLSSNGNLLLTQRPVDGFLGGLWKLPGGEKQRGESLTTALSRSVREEVGVEIRPGKKLGTVEAVYSHFRVTLHLDRATIVSGSPRKLTCHGFKWTLPDSLNELAFSKADRQAVAVAEKSVQ